MPLSLIAGYHLAQTQLQEGMGDLEISSERCRASPALWTKSVAAHQASILHAASSSVRTWSCTELQDKNTTETSVCTYSIPIDDEPGTCIPSDGEECPWAMFDEQVQAELDEQVQAEFDVARTTSGNSETRVSDHEGIDHREATISKFSQSLEPELPEKARSKLSSPLSKSRRRTSNVRRSVRAAMSNALPSGTLR